MDFIYRIVMNMCFIFMIGGIAVFTIILLYTLFDALKDLLLRTDRSKLYGDYKRRWFRRY